MLIAVQDRAEDISALLASGPYDLPVLLDPSGEITSSYGITAIPSVVVVDAEGRIADVNVGFTSSSELGEMVREVR